MAYDRELADRVRAALTRRRNVRERTLFGGPVWFLRGNILVGVWRNRLIVRLGPGAEAALAEPHVRPFDVTGRPMRGWAMVDAEGLTAEGALEDWLDRAGRFVRSLPPKNEQAPE